MALQRLARIVSITALVELGTGILLLVDPALVVNLLLGTRADATTRVVGRAFGIALVALAAALRPMNGSVTAAAFQGALLYNGLVALFLASASVMRNVGGSGLWAVVALHAFLAVVLITTWRGPYQKKTNANHVPSELG
jgi:hypothetical protein